MNRWNVKSIQALSLVFFLFLTLPAQAGTTLPFRTVVETFRPKEEVVVLRYDQRAQPRENDFLRLDGQSGLPLIVRIEKAYTTRKALLVRAFTGHQGSTAPRVGDWYTARYISESEATALVPARRGSARWYFQPSVGAAVINYRESGLSDYQSTALTLVLNGGYDAGAWLAEGRFSIGVFSLGSNQSAVDARFVELDAVAGLPLLPRRSRFQMTLLGGGYLRSSLVGDVAIGYKTLTGPCLYPRFRLAVGAGAITTYVRYSPILDGLSLLPLDQRELAVGIAWSAPLSEDTSYRLSLDYSQLKFSVRQFTTESTTWLASVGLLW